MNIRKLKALSVLIIIVIFVIVFFSVLYPEKKRLDNLTKQDDEISTEVVFTVPEVSNDSYVEDYTNLTEDEKEKMYETYGRNNCLFTSEGIYILPASVDEAHFQAGKLITDIWPCTEHTKQVKKPECGEISFLEDGANYLSIILNNVDSDGLIEYANDVKQSYKENKQEDKKNGLIYSGQNEYGQKFIVVHSEKNKTAQIYYTFL